MHVTHTTADLFAPVMVPILGNLSIIRCCLNHPISFTAARWQRRQAESDVIIDKCEAPAHNFADHEPGVHLANEQQIRAHLRRSKRTWSLRRSPGSQSFRAKRLSLFLSTGTATAGHPCISSAVGVEDEPMAARARGNSHEPASVGLVHPSAHL